MGEHTTHEKGGGNFLPPPKAPCSSWLRHLEACVLLEVALEFGNELLGRLGKLGALLDDITQVQLHVGVEAHGGQALAVRDANQNTARYGIAVQRGDELGKRGAVGAGDSLVARLVGKRLLGEEHGCILFLLEVNVRIIFQSMLGQLITNIVIAYLEQ